MNWNVCRKEGTLTKCQALPRNLLRGWGNPPENCIQNSWCRDRDPNRELSERSQKLCRVYCSSEAGARFEICLLCLRMLNWQLEATWAIVSEGTSDKTRCVIWIPCLESTAYSILWLLFLKEKTPWSESASEPYRPSDRRLSSKRLPTCADRRCHVVSVTDPYGRILDFLDRSHYFSIK
jgi:hypothetical protein